MPSAAIITKWTIYTCNPDCYVRTEVNQSVIMDTSQLYIRANTLSYGLYKVELNVTMLNAPTFKSSAFMYVRITQSNITANLVPSGTSIITSSHTKNLTLDPGTYSDDLADPFNPSDWTYVYYCRLYNLYDPTNIVPEVEEFHEQNHPCFSNSTHNGKVLEYSRSTSPNSSVTILAGSLASNQTYQFKVLMTNRVDSSFQADGYVLVNIQDSDSQLIEVGCVIKKMCSFNFEYQWLNPTTQVALFSNCIGNCATHNSIAWYIYQGSENSTTKQVKWDRFPPTDGSSEDRFFGINTSKFTATSKLFSENPAIDYWRFEVVYTFDSQNSSSALNFRINSSPKNGNCSINPLNGSTSTIFNINCSGWYDSDEIQGYAFYAWTIDNSSRMMLASTTSSLYGLRLLAGTGNSSLVNIIVHIRDSLGAVTEYNLPSVVVKSDTEQINTLLNILKHMASNEEIGNNTIIGLLSSDDPNDVGQALTSLSQVINEMNNHTLENTIANGVPAAGISISPLGSATRQQSSVSLNKSALAEYKQQLNEHARLRDYLLSAAQNFAAIDADSIKIQASTLAQSTASTSELTRAISMLASTKCHKLSSNLLSIANKTSKEDVELAARHIAACATNVLSAVNAPLQDRGIVLDLDSDGANAFPEDFDTDLEFEWANQNLFTDGNDFSPETIKKGRNTYYQKQMADAIADQVSETFASITAALNIHTNLGQINTMNSPSVFVSVQAASSESLSNRTFEQVGGARIRVPLNLNLTVNGSENVFVRSIMQPLASLGKSHSNAKTNLSTSISFSLLYQNGTDIPINGSLDEPFEFIIPRDPNAMTSSIRWTYVSSQNGTNQSFNLHAVNISRDGNLSVSLHFEIRPVNATVAYWFIYKFEGAPQVNSSIKLIDGWSLLCPSDLTSNGFYRYFIDNQNTTNHESVVFGLRELNSTEMLDFCSNISTNVSLPIIPDEPFDSSSDYELRTYTSGCYYLDSDNNWQSDGLVVGPLTNLSQTQCFSYHLTTFAGGFLPLPVTINWKKVFSDGDFGKNKTIYITTICVCILYLILIVFARFRDKKDIEKTGITFLPDNCIADRYFYEIIVFTGHRKDSGTESKVQFVLGGDDDETSVRTLADPHRKILQTSGVDAFIMAVPKCLGPLNYLHIWHDNTGQGALASWFLKYIIIRDLQTMTKTHFICQRWFAVEKDDGIIERLLPVAGEYQKQQFSYALSKQAYHSMSDGHLWFSIFSRPPSSKFTRVQRCTCCFVLFFTAMLFKVLYYKYSETVNNNADLSLGPIRVNREEIAISLMVEILSFLPSLLIVQLFRRIRQRNCNQHKVSPIDEEMMKTQGNRKKKTSKLTFPWWCIFLAYSLSLLLVGISIFFIIARGIELEDQNVQKWLKSVIIGFVQSVCLTEPLKVISLAIFFTIFMRNLNDDEEMTQHIDDTNYLNLIHDKQRIHSNQDKSKVSHRATTRVNRLNKYEVEEARIHRTEYIQMWSIVREILSYLCFLWIVYTIACSNRTNNDVLQVNHLRQFFLNIGHPDYDYTKIASINEYWPWLENSFIKKLRARRWYNGNQSLLLRGFTNDTTNRLIGWATMRQLRIKSESCQGKSTIGRLNLTCESDYDLFNEEQRSFLPGWTEEQTTKNYSASIRNAFVYNSSKQLDTYLYVGNHATYGSGGYVYQFRGRVSNLESNLSQLHQLGWIDDKTRAVIIQCTLYNPNVKMFTSVTLLAEFLSTGGVIPTARFEPIHFHDFTSLFHLIIAMIYMVFILYFMIVEVQSLFHLKRKYFRHLWCYIEWGIIAFSWAAVSVYVWRYREMTRISSLFRQTKGYVYINLQLATYVNDVLTFLIGFCCFFGTIKLLRFCRFHRRISLLADTLQYAGKDLLLFTMTLSILFMAFLVLFYLLFSAKIWACSSLLQTAQMLFEIILMKFDATEIREADTALGPLCFTLFIVFVVFIGMTMFISIINDGFRKVRQKSRLVYNPDYEMLGYIWNKFLRWTGLKNPDGSKIQEERDRRMRSEYHDPIERFPEKIDQLIEAIDQVNINARNELPRHEIITFAKRTRYRRIIKSETLR